MMFRVIGCAILYLILVSPSFALEPISPRIVNGKPTTLMQFPSFVSLYYDRIEYDGRFSPVSFCGGTLLDDRHVLTAAHCLFDGRGQLDIAWLLFTVAGQFDNESDFPHSNIKTVRAEAVFYHPNYQDSSNALWANDIGIIRLERELNGQGFVQRPKDQKYRFGFNGVDDENNGFRFETVGHGNTRSGRKEDDRLLFTTMFYVSNARCQLDITPFGLTLNIHHLCFKGDGINPETELSNGTCQGDSGGPIFWNNAGHLIQVGITSFGPSECGSGFQRSKVTSVFTEIYGYREWIDGVLAGTIDANLLLTEEDRLAYVDDGVIISTEPPEPEPESADTAAVVNTGAGGSWSWLWSVLLLAYAYLRRSNYIIHTFDEDYIRYND